MAVIDAVTRKRAQEVVGTIARQGRVRAAYLFGSRVTGTADQFSDLDIAAFVEDFDSWDIRRRIRAAVTAQKQVGDDVDLHLFPAEALDEAPPASFAAYIQDCGIRIEGAEESK